MMILTFEPLTGFIDFYLYLLLGYDFDTFSEYGGTEWLQKSQDVVDLAQKFIHYWMDKKYK